MDLLLAERLLLISLDPRTGKVNSKPPAALAPALAGALVMDLISRGAAQLEGGLVVPSRPVDDALLDETLGRIAAKRRPRRLKYWVRALRDPRKQLLGRLVERGVLAERPYRILWLFPSTRYELVVHEALEETTAPLRSFLMGLPETPTPEVAALVALVSVTGLVGSIVPRPHLRDARRRAKAVAKGHVGGQAVSEIVSESQAAVIAVITGNAAASTVINR
jgi:hypothetical protein